MGESEAGNAETAWKRYRLRHLRFGWGAVLVFSLLGLFLEALHGFKIPWYLSVATEARRLLWTLGHAHGTLLGLVHVAFAASLPALCAEGKRWHHLPVVSAGLVSGGLLIPFGFLLGGVFIRGGDPGLGALLVPPGALVMLFAVALIAARAMRAGAGD